MGNLTNLFAALQRKLNEERRIRRTYAELNALPTDSLLDLDFYRGDLRRVARNAVRGS